MQLIQARRRSVTPIQIFHMRRTITDFDGELFSFCRPSGNFRDFTEDQEFKEAYEQALRPGTRRLANVDRAVAHERAHVLTAQAVGCSEAAYSLGRGIILPVATMHLGQVIDVPRLALGAISTAPGSDWSVADESVMRHFGYDSKEEVAALIQDWNLKQPLQIPLPGEHFYV